MTINILQLSRTIIQLDALNVHGKIHMTNSKAIQVQVTFNFSFMKQASV